MARTLVIVPAFNEETSLERVVNAIRTAVPQADVAVVDDGSEDGTGAVADRLGVIALHLPHNLGIGGAEQTGLRYALRCGYDVAVRTDGDGQHDPAEIPRLLEGLTRTGADVVVGSRYLEDRGYVTPPLRRLGTTVLAWCITLVGRVRVTDPTSGFRAFGHRALQLCGSAYPHDYPEPESLVLFARAGLRVTEVPVSMRCRVSGRSSIGAIESGYYMVRVLLAIGVSLLRTPHLAPSDQG